ncbi:hypothetical protein ACQ4PT_023606 [Festuca glaucescens]
MHLPPELLLEILELCDLATLIPCAAACRLFRCHILSPAFLQRRRAAARGSFTHSSLVGVFYRHCESEARPRPPLFTTITAGPAAAVAESPFPLVPDVFRDYTPVESRDGLLVLRSIDYYAVKHAGLCVYDPVTGRRAFLPPPVVYDLSYALRRTGDDDGSSWFRLTAVDLRMGPIQAQSFSPADGSWGPVIEAPNPRLGRPVVRLSPVILSDAAHWLCGDNRSILTFHLDTMQLGRIEIPGWQHWHTFWTGQEQQLLASSPDGELSMIFGDRLVISIWVLTPGAGWTRRKRVDMGRILPAMMEPGLPFRRHRQLYFEWFGERSGTVLAQVAGLGLFAVNLQTEEVCTIGKRSRDIAQHSGTAPTKWIT